MGFPLQFFFLLLVLKYRFGIGVQSWTLIIAQMYTNPDVLHIFALEISQIIIAQRTANCL